MQSSELSRHRTHTLDESLLTDPDGSDRLAVCTGMIATARASNRAGRPIGVAYLSAASALMQQDILPSAEQLCRSQADAVGSSERLSGKSRATTKRVPLMRTITIAFALASALLAGCSNMQPVAEVSASLTTLPLPSGAAVASNVSGAPVESCDATASLRPSTAVGPAVEEIRRRGRLIVGIDQSTNLFSFRDPGSVELQGFDVDISREIARDLLGDPDKLQFRLLTSQERIRALRDTSVDIVAKAMTITCARAEQIAFSTVYFEASQRLLVPKDSPISGPGDLPGRRVCSGADTTSIATIARVAPTATLLAVPNWDDCLVALQQGQADAVSTDDSILAGMAVQDPNLHIVGPSLEAEPYGIGVNKSQDDLVRAVNASLERIRRDGTWMSLYHKWLSVLGPLPGPPEPKYRD
jgi:polar amino acid transport system substrate-binding protein